jgi:hypothetical protein
MLLEWHVARKRACAGDEFDDSVESHLMREENALREYGMTGANVPSIASFKAGFGSEYCQYRTFVMTKPS